MFLIKNITHVKVDEQEAFCQTSSLTSRSPIVFSGVRDKDEGLFSAKLPDLLSDHPCAEGLATVKKILHSNGFEEKNSLQPNNILLFRQNYTCMPMLLPEDQCCVAVSDQKVLDLNHQAFDNLNDCLIKVAQQINYLNAVTTFGVCLVSLLSLCSLCRNLHERCEKRRDEQEKRRNSDSYVSQIPMEGESNRSGCSVL